jgi:uncharacterized SAM-binding protein YcdF (DUF218 family)
MRDSAEEISAEKARVRMPPARILALAAAALLPAWLIVTSARIASAASEDAKGSADVAIILGAATSRDGPSPVFEERIRHGIALYQAGTVNAVLFTGGRGDGAPASEAAVARAYAIRAGIPASAILVEEKSQTTQQNLAEARAVMRRNGVRSALIVSDPLHMKRAMRMATDLGIAAEPAPTPTSRYRGIGARGAFLARETVFYTLYLITGR